MFGKTGHVMLSKRMVKTHQQVVKLTCSNVRTSNDRDLNCPNTKMDFKSYIPLNDSY